jgi:hypothetical protein
MHALSRNACTCWVFMCVCHCTAYMAQQLHVCLEGQNLLDTTVCTECRNAALSLGEAQVLRMMRVRDVCCIPSVQQAAYRLCCHSQQRAWCLGVRRGPESGNHGVCRAVRM